MNPWIFVLIGGLFETGWAICLKMSNGLTDLIWLIPTAILLVVSVLLLNKGLIGGISAGSGYSVWVGIGAIGSLIMGLILFDEVLSLLKVIFIAFILVGVIGIEKEQQAKSKKSN